MLKILYFSTVNWKWIKQRPHFISYYMSQQGHEVDYLSLNPLGKVKVKKINMGRLRVMDSYVLPYSLKSRAVERLNAAYIRSLLKRKIYDIIILTNPLQLEYIPQSARTSSTLVYECMDNMPYFYEGRLRERMFSEEQRLLDIADAVITSSDKLRDELQSRAPNKHLRIQTVYNALDQETFRQTPVKIHLREPNMVYIGTIGHWLDWGTLKEFAAKHPRYTIYMIGPYENKKKTMPPNIEWLGVIPHHEVIHYIFSGNIMLLPFKINELTQAVDPVKMYEYLALNKPVISSYWPELDRFKCDNLKFYRNYDEFETYALQTDNGGLSGELNHRFMEQYHWGSRAREYMTYIEGIRKLNS